MGVVTMVTELYVNVCCYYGYRGGVTQVCRGQSSQDIPGSHGQTSCHKHGVNRKLLLVQELEETQTN